MADFLLSVGVDVGLSYTEMQKDISALVSKLNSNPPKIKVGLDIDNTTLTNFKKQVEALNKSLGSTPAVKTKGSTSQSTTQDTAATNANTKAKQANAAATAQKAQADANAAATAKQRDAAEKACLTTIIKLENAIQKWTKAEHSKNAESQRSYRALQEEAAALRQVYAQYSQMPTPNVNDVNNLTNATSKANIAFKATESVLKANGDATKSLTDRVGGLAEKFNTWFSISQVIMAAYRTVRQMISNVIELDTAMTELRKVTDETEATYNQFLDNATVRARNLGAALSDVVTATSDFARLGFNISEAEELADAAIVYKNVGDGIDDISTASESIIATMQAFGIEAKDVMTIVDKFNEVGNNYAISSKGVGDALLRSAAAMKSANNTLDETIALATASNTIVQDPEKVGTTLKTVSMYLRAAKTEAEDAGESTDGMANSVSELRSEILALTGNKVDIQIDDDTFKSTYQILQELSEVWHDLSDVSQANILEMVGGKRNSNVVAAILENFTVAEEAIKTSADSAGSALLENEKYLDSIQGKISQFKASFEAFSSSIFNSDLIKFVVDFAAGFIRVLDSLQRLHLLLPAIISAFAVYKSIGMAKTNLDAALKTDVLAASLIKEKTVTDALSTSVANLTVAEKKELVSKINNAVISKTLTAEEAQQILTTLGLATAEGTLTAANKGLAASFKSLSASIPVWGWIALGVSVLIDIILGVSSAVDAATVSVEEMESEFNSLTSSIRSAASEYRNLKTSAEEVIPRFAELAAGVDKFGENVKLTDDEYEEFLQLNNKIAEMFPELNLGMNSNGNAMLSLSYTANTLEESLWGVVEAQREATNAVIANQMPDLLSNINGQMKQYNDQINTVKTETQDILDMMEKKSKGSYDFKINTTSSDPDKVGKFSKEFYEYIDLLNKYGVEYELKRAAPASLYYDVVIKDQAAAEKALKEGMDKSVANIESEMKSTWSEMNEVVSAWIQVHPLYESLDKSIQPVALKLASNIDFSSLGLDTEQEIQNYVKNNVLSPLYNAEPEVQNALVGLFDLNELYNKGALYAGEYKSTIDAIITDLESAGVDSKIINSVKLSLDYSTFDEQLTKVKNGLTDAESDITDFINNLSASDLTFAYQIINSEGSMSIDELKEKIDQLRYQNSDYINPLDLGTFLEDIDTAVDGIDNLVSAMEKLKKGTALTKSQLIELANQYPKLLENSNLFTDGSIEGQQKMLQAILDTYEAEYDAQIDTKIAELEATQQVINDQLDLEKQKSDLIGEIKNMSVNGQLDQEEELVGKISELNDLQGQNYVSYKNGELQVNEEALNDKLGSELEYGEKSVENIWNPYGNAIVSTHNQAYNNGLKATGQYASNLLTRLKNVASNVWGGFGNLISDVMSGNYKKGTALDYFKGITGSSGVSGGKVEVNFGGDDVTVGGQSIDDWISEQEDASNKRIDALNKLETKTVNAINNLKALKGLKLTDIYASNKSDSSSKKDKDEDEENIFKTMYNSHKHLVAMEQETTADFLKWLNEAYKAAYKQGEITLDEYYKYEEEVFQGMQELRNEAKDSIDNLAEFRVDMLKQEIEDEKDALEKKLDNLKEFYDKQKEMLQDKYDEEKYLEEQSEKRKSVADITSELAMLEKDDSAWAQKRKLELNEELADAEKDLADFEKENALEKALDAIDEAYNSQEAQIQREMEALDEKLNDPNALFNKALEDIKNNSKNQLYYQMLMYNRQYGDGNDETVKKLWEDAYGALSEYEKLFGKLYQGISLNNETGFQDEGNGGNEENSGTNPDNQPKNPPKPPSTPKNTKPPLSSGSTVKIKSTATHFGSNSNGVKMASYVPGGSYTVYQTSGDQVLVGRDGVYTGWVKKSDIEGYASGTKHATAGLHELYEQGAETLFVSGDGSKYRILNDEDKVLNAKATNFLYDFANGGENALAQMLKNVFGSASLSGITPSIISNEINMGDIVVQGSADTRTVSEIRRAQRESVDFMLKEFTKLNK